MSAPKAPAVAAHICFNIAENTAQGAYPPVPQAQDNIHANVTMLLGWFMWSESTCILSPPALHAANAAHIATVGWFPFVPAC
jgi:hypothetical protein